MLEKRGHIPSVLLFIGAVVLVVLSIFSFVSFSGTVKTELNTTLTHQQSFQFIERYPEAVFEDSVAYALSKTSADSFFQFCSFFQERVALRDPKNAEFGTFFSTVRNFDCVLGLADGSPGIILPAFNVSFSSPELTIYHERIFEARFNEGFVQYIYK